MRLNHLDLAVPDVVASRDFFTAFLGFEHVETLGQGGLVVLQDSTGSVLVLSRLRRSGSQTYPEGFHIGFHLSRREDVLALHARLTEAIVATPSEFRVQRGATNFYFTVPGGILVEIAARPPD